ncbi:MAG TPA: hypothetical protein EYH26_00285 [Pyrodictium sp.]|nr:hypothetical protein [Pyrodictium sp.]
MIDMWATLTLSVVLLLIGVYLRDRQMIRWAITIIVIAILVSSNLLTNVEATLDLTALLK